MMCPLNPPKGTPITIEAGALRPGDEVSFDDGETFHKVKRTSASRTAKLGGHITIYTEVGAHTMSLITPVTTKAD